MNTQTISSASQSWLTLRALRVVALVLALVGVFGVRQASLARALPVTPAAQVDPAWQGAYARMVGRVSAPPRYDAATRTLSFWMDDGTGSVRVSVYRAVSDAVRARAVPQAGDTVDVAGVLRVREGGEALALTVQDPERLVVTRPAARAVGLGALGVEDALARVTVRARVLGVRRPVPGLTVVSVRDASGRGDVTLTDDVVALSVPDTAGEAPPLAELAPGDSVVLTGTVTLYRDAPQVALGDTRELVRLVAGAVAPREIALDALGVGDAGRWVRVSGTLGAGRAFNGGTRYAVSAGEARVTLIVWDSLEAPVYVAGSAVEVMGVVSVYQGRIELTPDLVEDVRVTALGTGTAPEDEDAPLTALDALSEGARVRVEARVVEAASFAAGFKFVLADERGRAVLLVWQGDYAYVPEVAGLRPGALVRVVGTVQSYQGELQIVPEGGRGVTVVEAGQGPELARRVIHEVTGADVNTQQLVQGQVVSIKPFSSGMRFYLDDGSGSVQVVVWQNVWDAVPGRERIGVGATVAVVGRVEVYREQVQIVPALPVYVEVK